MMGELELAELARDIRENGLQVPIVTYQGMILDGRNRARACEMVGVGPHYREWQGQGSPTAWVISLNLHRRHLTQSQKAAIAVDALPLFEQEARKRQEEAAARTNEQRRQLRELNAAAENGDELADWKALLLSKKLQRERNADNKRVYFIESDGKIKIGNSVDPNQRLKQLQTGSPDSVLVAHFPGGVEFETFLHKQFAELRLSGEWYQDSPTIRNVIDDLNAFAKNSKTEDAIHAHVQGAKMFGVSPAYVSDAKKLKAEAPDLYQSIRKGQQTITEAKRELKERKREEVREQNRELVQSTPPASITHFGGQRYQTIVLDPPWDWGDEGDCDQYGCARPSYATMPIADIVALPVGDLVTDNAHIYLWITNRSLPKGFRLLEEWGFRYVTMLTWCKPSIGIGNYFRGSTEQILFGVRGSLPLLRRDVGTHFTAPRTGRHSGKPDEFYQLVESCSPGPWLEMFSRQERRGWVAWGAEVTSGEYALL